MLLKYFQRRKKEKLYRQWVERAGLPSETIHPEADKPLRVHPRPDRPDSPVATHSEVGGDMMAKIDKRQRRLPLLYVLLGVCIVILCGGLVLLITQSC